MRNCPRHAFKYDPGRHQSQPQSAVPEAKSMNRMLSHGVIGNRFAESAPNSQGFRMVQEVPGYLAKTSPRAKLRLHHPLGHFHNLRILLPDLKNAVSGDLVINGKCNGGKDLTAVFQGDNFFRIIHVVVRIGVAVGFIDGL